MTITAFDIWTADEPEFIEGAEHKFNVLTYPVNIAMGTGGKNDHLAKAIIGIMADWALRKLFMVCAKVLWWITWEKVRRAFEKATGLR